MVEVWNLKFRIALASSASAFAIIRSTASSRAAVNKIE